MVPQNNETPLIHNWFSMDTPHANPTQEGLKTALASLKQGFSTAESSSRVWKGILKLLLEIQPGEKPSQPYSRHFLFITAETLLTSLL